MRINLQVWKMSSHGNEISKKLPVRNGERVRLWTYVSEYDLHFLRDTRSHGRNAAGVAVTSSETSCSSSLDSSAWLLEDILRHSGDIVHEVGWGPQEGYE
jgi:hypothetical protein